MANTTIQIRRSTLTATPGSLANGELAFTANGDVLFIGSSSTVIPIGGKRFPGTLTSNQALVANSTGGIDKVITANLVPTNIWANGAAGTGGQVLTANATGGVYWATATSGVAGNDTEIQFNDGGALAGDPGLTYNKTTDALTANGSFNVGTTFVANSTQIVIGTVGTNAVASNTTAINIGNSTVNATINSTSFSGSAASLGGVVAASYVQNTDSRTLSGNLNFTGANVTFSGANHTITSTNTYISGNVYINSSIQVGTINNTNGVLVNTTTISIGNSSVNATINSTVFTGSSNNASYLSGVAAANFVQNTDSRTLSGNLTFTGSNLSIGPGSGNVNITTSNTYISGNVAVAGANITATGATLSIKDIIASGNLTVQGTLTTIDTVNIQVKDATLKLADQNTTTDLIDFGFYGQSGNSTATYYSGLVRDHNLGTVANSVYTLFSTATEPGQTVDNTAPTYSLSTLRSYLTTTGLTTNSSTLAITATGSVNVAIVANTLTLSTALGVDSGGSGRATLTNNAILVGNTVGAIGQVSSSTEGHVLQISSGVPTFSMLDGGTF